MSGFDLFLAGLLLVFTITGAWCGLISSLISIFSALVGWIAAFRFGEQFSSHLPFQPPVSKTIAFLLIFFAILFLGKVLAAFMTKVLFGHLKLLNRFLGGVFGFLEGFAFSFALLYVLVVFVGNRNILKGDSLSRMIYEGGSRVVSLIGSSNLFEVKPAHGPSAANR